MPNWRNLLKGDPFPWLLQDDTPAVKNQTLRLLMDRSEDDDEVRQARAAAMESDPIKAIIAAQHSEGYWEKPGPGYATKYRGTVWQVIFLDQLGADGTDEHVRSGCEYVLTHSQSEVGGFGATGSWFKLGFPSGYVADVLQTLEALCELGFAHDPRMENAIQWLLAKQDNQGRWRNQYAYNGKTWIDFEPQGAPSKWVTLRACRVLKAAYHPHHS